MDNHGRHTPERLLARTRRRLSASIRLGTSGVERLEDLYAALDRQRDQIDEIGALLRSLGDRQAVTSAQIEDLRRVVDQVQAAQRAAESSVVELAATQAAATLHLADVDAPEVPPDGPLVSVVMPAWQRAEVVRTAVRSVQSQTYRSWELLVVDDGSDDATDEVVSSMLGDERIAYERIEHQGAAAARNHALRRASGHIVAYLDTDNTWHPTHLARHVAALESDADACWAVSGQLVLDAATGRVRVRNDHRSIEQLRRGNFIDLNVLTHRREVLDEIGLFDEGLPRLSDWDLIARLSQLSPPVRIRAVTCTYRTDVPGRISDHLPIQVHAHTVRSRYRGRPADGLKVLLAEWHYPQITETYVGAIVQGLTALGAEVHVWSQDDVAVPYPSPVPVHRGSLADALGRLAPDVVVTDWLHKGEELRPVTRAAGIPHVVRTHGFEHDPAIVTRLLDDEGVVVHTFPHLVDPSWADHPRLDVTVTCFDDDLYRPATGKDPHLVVRTAAGLFTKDLDVFLLAAARCPEHRFVLVLGHALLVEERTEALVARAAELGSPCEVRVDLQHPEVASLLTEAAIYLHTHGTDHPVSMPMSIAEAMATGCWVLGRDLPGMAEYIGPCGALYDGATTDERADAAARLVNRSLSWAPGRWEAVATEASEQAFARHASRDVVEQMVRSWDRAFDLRASRRCLPSGAR